MESIPNSDRTPIFRTDFSDDHVWKVVCNQVNKLPPEFREKFAGLARLPAFSYLAGEDDLRFVDVIDDVTFADLAPQQLLDQIPQLREHTFFFIADCTTMSQPHHPVLVVDLYHQPGRSFRALPIQIRTIQNNLSLGNLDWEGFVQGIDPDGVFRGFAKRVD